MISSHDVEPKLGALIAEWLDIGVGEKMYTEICAIVKAAVIGGGYPVMYSPTGVWDEEAFCTLANDLLIEKLLKRDYLAYLLQANTSISGFRKGVESVFKNFLISKKKRTVLDNLFRRANEILHRDNRFKCFAPAGKKAHSLWGLSVWDDKGAFSSSEEALVQTGLGLGKIEVTEYRPDAKKLSHVLSDEALSDYLHDLFMAVESLLSLGQIINVIKYRFNLLDVKFVSLEEPAFVDDEGSILTVGDTIGVEDPNLATIEVGEATAEVLQVLSPRQKKIFIEFQEPRSTLSSIGECVGCSKSTVDNELKQICSTVSQVVDDDKEALAVFTKLAEILREENKQKGVIP